MAQFVKTNTPGGEIYVEVENVDEEFTLVASKVDRSIPFEEASSAIKENARHLKEELTELTPDEVEISCGLKFGAEGGNSVWGLAKVTGEASYTVTMKWKANKGA